MKYHKTKDGTKIKLSDLKLSHLKNLEEKLLSEINRIDVRCEQLRKYVLEYKEDNDYENAMKNDIKYRQLKMVSQSLKKLLY
jgi:hypothetical protein